MSVEDHLKSKNQTINTHLDSLVPSKQHRHRRLYEAARYALLSGGKRIRPILCLATVELLGADEDKALTPACALEMIHSYSMIHDDLPCMDDDDFRRGQPTVHRAFPESHAVLAGDFLLTYAFELLASAPGLSDQQKLALITCLSQASGGEGMIGGQVLDIECEGKQGDLSLLQELHSKKTGALITASLEFGAIIAGARTQETQLLRRFGQDLGLAFQVVDDIMDVLHSEEKHGRSVSTDELKEKTTYVTVLGLEQAQQVALNLLQSALSTLESIEKNTLLLSTIAQSVVSRAMKAKALT